MPKKFKNEEEYYKAIHKIEWQSKLYYDSFISELKNKINNVPHQTNNLKDSLFLLKLLTEKLDAHNGQCNQLVGKMKTSYYKRDNIES